MICANLKLKSFTLMFICSLACAKYTFNVTSKSTKVQIVESIQGYFLKNIASRFSFDFNTTSNEEMGVLFIQKLYEKFKYNLLIPDFEKKLGRITTQLEVKLNETFEVLNQTLKIIENYYKVKNDSILNSAVLPCSNIDYDLEEFDITNTLSFTNNSYSEQPINIKQVLKNQRLKSKKLKGLIKQQYFLSSYDITTNENLEINSCNEQNHSLLWTTYVANMEQKNKNILLLLDHGGSLSKQQFKIVKAIAKQLISVLNENDRIGVVGIGDDISVPYLTEQCFMPNQVSQVEETYTLTSAIKHYKDLLNRFINNLVKGNGATNHSLGFQQALQIIKASNISSNDTIMLLYVSRGLLSSLTEAKTVLETILNNIDELDNSVIINTCAVIDESKPIMYETHFLRDVAEQNYSKYNIEYDEEEYIKGIMLSVNSTQGVGLATARFLNSITGDKIIHGIKPKLSLPIWDSYSSALIISVTVPCGANGDIGILGMDLYLANLVEDITYYSNYLDYTYAFIIDKNGTAIMHPSYPRPMAVNEQPNYVDISNLEKVKFFKEVKDLMIAKTNGQYTLKNENETLIYYWKTVLDMYIVCLVVRENLAPPKRPYKVTWFPTSTANKLVHHRLDIIPAPRMCKHLNQLSTLDAGSLYLSASCFQSPSTYAHQHTSSPGFSILTVQKCMAFLKDNTRYLSNPGLREEIKDDVATLAHILEYLRTQHLQGPKGKYVVRRYVTSPSGVLQIFPGGIISPGFEPTKRTWFLRALEHKFKTILTPPYLDAGGAGYIVTIAYATEHAVVGMDVTFGYIYKLMLENMPFCTAKKIKCLLMDDRGYLIYHPNLIDPNGYGPIEQQHIIHKESLVANDILNHNNFVKKKLCNNYADGTIQRFYRLNTSIDHVLVNAVHGEHSVKYQVSAVEGTNVFIGVVNATFEVVATFCPCSMINRLCLNCNRMEQRECECPCECPLNLNTCTHPNKSLFENPLCTAMPEQSFSLPLKLYNNMNEDLKPCLPIACEELVTYESCLGVLGCEWCRLDVDGESILPTPFCTSIQTCFNGILGSPTPYGNLNERSLDSTDLLGTGFSPIGPIIGCVLAVCLILVFSFICYRSYTSPTIERFYLTSAQDNQVRMSDLNLSDDYHELDNHQDKLLQDNKKPEPISPYCVSTGYRRPITAADSDHGYSTMTPHDESEHLSFAPVEIDSLEDDCTSDAASINTSVSSKRHMRLLDKNTKVKLLLPDLQVTNLSSRNCIIAPVTVHRNMEFA